MLDTTRSLGRSAAAWLAGTLRNSTLNNKPRNVRQHRHNKTSSAWCTRWDQRIAASPGNGQLRLVHRLGARLNCGRRRGHCGLRPRCFIRRCLLAYGRHCLLCNRFFCRCLRVHHLPGSSLLSRRLLRRCGSCRGDLLDYGFLDNRLFGRGIRPVRSAHIGRRAAAINQKLATVFRTSQPRRSWAAINPQRSRVCGFGRAITPSVEAAGSSGRGIRLRHSPAPGAPPCGERFQRR
ncbi:hypothetical protein OKW42_006574 [Paraburkholderia sp. WC7.3d]